MTFSGHIAAAAIILTVTKDPATVVAGCLVAHYLVDAIPHAEWQPESGSSLLAKGVMTADTLVTAILIVTMFLALDAPISLIIAAQLVSILPDLTDKFARKYLKPLRYFHDFLHTWPQLPGPNVDWSKTVTGRTPILVKIFIQALLVVYAQLLLVDRIASFG